MYKKFTIKNGIRDSFAPKFLLVMRIITIILLASIMQVSARSFAQEFTISKKSMSVKELMSEIRRQSEYTFLYTSQILLKAKPVDMQLTSASLQEVLDKFFQDQPLSYVIAQKEIILKEKEATLKVSMVPNPDTVNVHGRVLDHENLPLPGANIIAKTKTDSIYAIAGPNGEFEFRGLEKGSLLRISFIGYLSRQLRAKSRMGNINLELSSAQLDETQVIAYGSESRRFSVGSVSTVTAEDIENQPVTNVLQALQGRVAGLAVNSTSGVPGALVQVQIRGQNSLLSNTSLGSKPYDQPLFIVDGVPLAPQNNDLEKFSSLATSTTGAGGFSAFNNINPNDIESIRILKDADATSIYGTQGLNGVILITTKKGKPGKNVVSASVNSGYNFATRSVQLLNTQQYLDLRKETFKNDGFTPSSDANDPGYAPDLTIFDQNKYTDYYKKIFGNSSKSTDINISSSGGSANTTYFVSGGYTRADYNFPGNFADQRLTVHSTFHHSSVSNKFTLDFGTDYSYDDNNAVGNFIANTRILLPPNTPDLIDGQGNLQWNYKGVDLSNYQFNAYLMQPSSYQSYLLNNSIRIGYKILPGLELNVNGGYSRNTTFEQQQFPGSSQSPKNPHIYANFGTTNAQTINIEPQLDYSKSISKGMLSVLAGATYKKNLNDFNREVGDDYSSDYFLGSITGAGSVRADDNYDIYKYVAVFGRIKYIYDQKYIISLTGRRDGSSNFGEGHQFGSFGSAGLGWIFSEEKIAKAALPFLSYGKLSASYGTSGSDGVQSYQYQALWQPNTSQPTFENIRPYQATNLYNPDYSWSLKKTLNAAVDLGFFDNRLLLNATYYRSRVGNQLTNYALPTQTGFISVLENLNATVQNTGWEFALTSGNIKGKDFSWTSTFNISTNRNKLISFPGLASSSFAYYYAIGQPTTMVLGYKYKGVNPQTGLFEYYAANGEATSSPDSRLVSRGGDVVPVANTEPKFYGGLGNDFTYKQFSLSLFFQFSKSTAPNYKYGLYASGTPPGALSNQPVEALNHWRQPGDIAELQKLTAATDPSSPGFDAFNAGSLFSQSSGAYSTDTYLRLKTLALSYTLPEALLKRLRTSNFRVFVRGQNLLTITNYKVGDPEQPGNYTAFPLQRTLMFGLSFNF